jgi:caffeoyl-CoA O-methyltransferase
MADLTQIINPAIQTYAETYSTAEDELLSEIAGWTNKNHPEAVMLSGHLQGKFLEMISCIMQPARILEIGTFTGYSALCLAKGLTANGQLHTIELREEDANRARAYFDRSIFKNKIILHRGNALKIIPEIEETWDLVFIDADKPAYVEYFNLVLPMLRKNGVILADNVFFHGQVLDRQVKGKSAQGIQAFNEYIRSRHDIDKMIVTIRDGLYLIRKI